jgi:hypothetical protein
MYIKEYYYGKPTVKEVDYNAIPSISRDGFATSEFMKLVPKIALTRPTAVLYAGGAVSQSSENRVPSKNSTKFSGSINPPQTKMQIMELAAYALHKWVGSMINNHYVVYANVNGNTCASSMHSIYEAFNLIKDGVVEEVIIIAEERINSATLRTFNENNINISLSDGFAFMRLSKEGEGYKIIDSKWSYLYNRNPFGVSEEGYNRVYFGNTDTVKVHGTGTSINDTAESFIDKPIINYKKDLGHTLGASALVELCMLLDDNNVKGSVECLASGLGGFYGSCVLIK